jgi:tRNA dimethylallyltransferase
MKQKTCIVITGPTAIGKTAIAIEIAQHFKTRIISADSRQCFRELNIGVAKPSPAELAAVHHYFINSHSIHEEVNAALFERLALAWAEEIFNEHDVAVMVGGTGLYIQAFCQGLDEMPVISPSVRTSIQSAFEKEGMPWLQQAVQEQDPLFFETGEAQNPQRLMRALEVKLSTGRSILSFRTAVRKERPFRIIKVGLDIPRPALYERINQRVDNMMQQGLLQEAEALFPFRHFNALQTVGYTELFGHLEGSITLEKAVELVKQHTRNYAKRQLTWFRKDHQISWFKPNDRQEIITLLDHDQ